MLGKVNGGYVVRFNNHGEVLRHYTMAPSEAKAKTNAAYEFAKILGKLHPRGVEPVYKFGVLGFGPCP